MPARRLASRLWSAVGHASNAVWLAVGLSAVVSALIAVAADMTVAQTVILCGGLAIIAATGTRAGVAYVGEHRRLRAAAADTVTVDAAAYEELQMRAMQAPPPPPPATAEPLPSGKVVLEWNVWNRNEVTIPGGVVACEVYVPSAHGIPTQPHWERVWPTPVEFHRILRATWPDDFTPVPEGGDPAGPGTYDVFWITRHPRSRHGSGQTKMTYDPPS